MANRNVEVFDNDIFNHETINVAIVAGDLESGDDSYDPYPRKFRSTQIEFLTAATTQISRAET